MQLGMLSIYRALDIDEECRMQPDSVLVQLVKDGQVSAYEDLVVRYRRAGMLTALRIVRNHHAAEDVVQESFVVAYRRLDTLRDGSKFGGWLMRIVGRQAVRERRKYPREGPLESMEGHPPARDNSEPHGCEQLMELIHRLPVHERLIVTLRHLDGHSISEIAEITGRPTGTVTKQLSRAVRRLRDMAAMQRSSQ